MGSEDIESIKRQRDRLKRALASQSRQPARAAAPGIFLLGLAVIAIWLLTNDDSTMSMLVFLVGAVLISLAIMLHFLSPARYLRAEVSDGTALSNTLNVDKILSELMIEEQGIYVPASLAGSTKIFLPAAGDGTTQVPMASASVFIAPKSGTKGILLDPPGYGLLLQARQIGADFTQDGLENEIKDILENGMELARTATVTKDDDRVRVSMQGLANAGLCTTVRNDYPWLCLRTGCPLCSFIACAIAEGTSRMVRINAIDVEGNTVQATFELI